jgi:hypothetical protein
LGADKEKRKKAKVAKVAKKVDIMEELKMKAKMVSKLDDFATPVGNLNSNRGKAKNYEHSSDYDSGEDEENPKFCKQSEEDLRRDMQEGMDG